MASNEAEELDYHITFPSPTTQEEYVEGSDTENVDINTKKEPVIILLGWMGCQEKHLAKYSDFYVNRRCITIQYTAPTSDLMQQPKLQSTAYKLLELIIDLGLDENPILFHVFSNGGGLVYHQVSEILCTVATLRSEDFREINIVGSIFDSCPGSRNATRSTKALMRNLQVNFILKYILGVIIFLYIFAKYMWRKVNIFSSDDGSEYWKYMQTEPSHWPQLFLYSKADDLIDYRDVDFIVSCRKKRGVNVSSQCWDDSPHVQHFVKHREAYINTCYNFLKKCIDLDEVNNGGEGPSSKYD